MGIVFAVRQTIGPKSPRSESIVEFFFVIKCRDVFSKVSVTERAFKFCRFTRGKMAPNQIVDIVTNDSKTVKFIDQDIYVNYNNMYSLETKEIIEKITVAANSLKIV